MVTVVVWDARGAAVVVLVGLELASGVFGSLWTRAVDARGLVVLVARDGAQDWIRAAAAVRVLRGLRRVLREAAGRLKGRVDGVPRRGNLWVAPVGAGRRTGRRLGGEVCVLRRQRRVAGDVGPHVRRPADNPRVCHLLASGRVYRTGHGRVVRVFLHNLGVNLHVSKRLVPRRDAQRGKGRAEYGNQRPGNAVAKRGAHGSCRHVGHPVACNHPLVCGFHTRDGRHTLGRDGPPRDAVGNLLEPGVQPEHLGRLRLAVFAALEKGRHPDEPHVVVPHDCVFVALFGVGEVVLEDYPSKDPR